MANTLLAPARGITLTERLRGWVRAIGAARARRAAYLQTYRELSQLSDRELNDIGIARSSIRSVALEHARNL